MLRDHDTLEQKKVLNKFHHNQGRFFFPYMHISDVIVLFYLSSVPLLRICIGQRAATLNTEHSDKAQGCAQSSFKMQRQRKIQARQKLALEDFSYIGDCSERLHSNLVMQQVLTLKAVQCAEGDHFCSASRNTVQPCPERRHHLSQEAGGTRRTKVNETSYNIRKLHSAEIMENTNMHVNPNECCFCIEITSILHLRYSYNIELQYYCIRSKHNTRLNGVSFIFYPFQCEIVTLDHIYIQLYIKCVFMLWLIY